MYVFKATLWLQCYKWALEAARADAQDWPILKAHRMSHLGERDSSVEESGACSQPGLLKDWMCKGWEKSQEWLPGWSLTTRMELVEQEKTLGQRVVFEGEKIGTQFGKHWIWCAWFTSTCICCVSSQLRAAVQGRDGTSEWSGSRQLYWDQTVYPLKFMTTGHSECYLIWK